ncbi:aspartate aminotransferase family protein [Marinococcus halotolerans]|uniref:aspartate aminotransferase family protein n=1 Tax=Marinococcus halotolerans TaxID=301092 RepID=UPI0003B7789B|nr:aspartate aminotransferase family protein [Marinococcus halotolerans]
MAWEPEEMKKRDEESIWHAMRPYSPGGGMVIEKADGSWVTDVDGREYLDGMAGLWCVNVGYGRKEIADAAYEQMLKLPFYPLTQSHTPAVQLTAKLDEWLGDGYMYFFSNSGSEANETALKLVRQYFQQIGEGSRYKTISRYRTYHGSTLATMAAGGQTQRKYRYEPLPPGFVHVTPPDPYRKPEGQSDEEYSLACADEIEQAILWEAEESIAAVIMEPIITGGGVLIPEASYMKRVRDICDRYGVLLISDEVICGFGRTGKRFGFMHADVKPDIVTMAKGITSGYMPLSVTAVRKDMYQAFTGSEAYDHFRHVNTFGGHPAACAAAVKNLEVMEREKLVERSEKKGRELLEALKELEGLPHVGQVRGRGLLAGIEFVEDKTTKKAAPEKFVKQILASCKKDGVIVGKTSDIARHHNNILTLSPPLNIEDKDFQLLITTLKKHVKAAVYPA